MSTNDQAVNQWFAAHLRAAMKSGSLSARELGRRADCSGSTVSRACAGQDITLSLAVRIADGLGMPIADLLTPVSCETCTGRPHPGFTCNECGASAR